MIAEIKAILVRPLLHMRFSLKNREKMCDSRQKIEKKINFRQISEKKQSKLAKKFHLGTEN